MGTRVTQTYPKSENSPWTQNSLWHSIYESDTGKLLFLGSDLSQGKNGNGGYKLISYLIGPNMNSFYRLWNFFCETQDFINFKTSLESILEDDSE